MHPVEAKQNAEKNFYVNDLLLERKAHIEAQSKRMPKTPF